MVDKDASHTATSAQQTKSTESHRKVQQRTIDTQNNILKAARQCFVEHGFMGASISMIAQQAGVNNSLIFHHFHNKHDLWLAVREQLKKDYYQMAQTVPPEAMESVKKLVRHIVEERIQHHIKEPQFTRMLNWIRLESDAATHNVALGAEPFWLEAIESMQAANKIDAQISSRLILVWILSSSEPLIYISDKYFESSIGATNYKHFIIHNIAEAIMNKEGLA